LVSSKGVGGAGVTTTISGTSEIWGVGGEGGFTSTDLDSGGRGGGNSATPTSLNGTNATSPGGGGGGGGGTGLVAPGGGGNGAAGKFVVRFRR
jgi:hypothetical protein